MGYSPVYPVVRVYINVYLAFLGKTGNVGFTVDLHYNATMLHSLPISSTLALTQNPLLHLFPLSTSKVCSLW